VKDNADYEITENDLAEWERMNQRKLDPLIILWTGWGSRFPDSLRYLGTESETDTSLQHFPGISFPKIYSTLELSSKNFNRN